MPISEGLENNHPVKSHCQNHGRIWSFLNIMFASLGGFGLILWKHSWPGTCCADQTGLELVAPSVPLLCWSLGPRREPVLFLVIKYVEYLLFGTRMMMDIMLVIIIFGLMRRRLKRVVCQCLASASCPRHKGNGDQRCLMNSWGCSWVW